MVPPASPKRDRPRPDKERADLGRSVGRQTKLPKDRRKGKTGEREREREGSALTGEEKGAQRLGRAAVGS